MARDDCAKSDDYKNVASVGWVDVRIAESERNMWIKLYNN